MREGPALRVRREGEDFLRANDRGAERPPGSSSVPFRRRSRRPFRRRGPSEPRCTKRTDRPDVPSEADREAVIALGGRVRRKRAFSTELIRTDSPKTNVVMRKNSLHGDLPFDAFEVHPIRSHRFLLSLVDSMGTSPLCSRRGAEPDWSRDVAKLCLELFENNSWR